MLHLVPGNTKRRKKLKQGAIPALNMSKKSIETPKATERKPRSVVGDYPIIERACYKDLHDFKNKLHS